MRAPIQPEAQGSPWIEKPSIQHLIHRYIVRGVPGVNALAVPIFPLCLGGRFSRVHVFHMKW